MPAMAVTIAPVGFCVILMLRVTAP
jgi:DNA-binding NtrC family response regulator